MYVYGQDGVIHPDIIGLLLVVNNNFIIEFGWEEVNESVAGGKTIARWIYLPISYTQTPYYILVCPFQQTRYIGGVLEQDVSYFVVDMKNSNVSNAGVLTGFYWVTIGF